MSDGDRFGLLFELSKDAVAEIELVAGEPVVRAVNPAFVEVFGYERKVIRGESLNNFIVPDNREAEASSFDERTAQGEVNWATVTRLTADGRREFLYRSVPFERGDSDRALAIYTDVTDQQRRERHHEVLHRVLRHNLRNNLTTILAATGELLTSSEDEAVHTEARRIRAAVDDLEELSHAAGQVQTLLGDGRPDDRDIDVAETLRALARRFRSDQKAVTVQTDLPETLTVRADRRLEVALGALAENAVEHSGPGEPHTSEAPEKASTDGSGVVRLALAKREREAVVEIRDDGPGIPEYERAAVFDDQPISQLSHGSGLGLWLAKWVVESYGGRLGYQRRGGETTVSVRLPLPGREET
jgi:PAS domain S-box-containing protein